MTDRAARRRAEVLRRLYRETWFFPASGGLVILFRDGTRQFVRIE